MTTKSIGTLVILLGFSLSSLAQTPVPNRQTSSKEIIKDVKETAATELPLSYRAWKEQQVLDAQNALLRAQNALRQADSDSRVRFEKDVKRASDLVDVSKEFTVEEYLTIYLSKYQDRADLVLQMFEKLSKEEAKEILTGTFRRAFQSNNAKQKPASLMVGSNRQ